MFINSCEFCYDNNVCGGEVAVKAERRGLCRRRGFTRGQRWRIFDFIGEHLGVLPSLSWLYTVVQRCIVHSSDRLIILIGSSTRAAAALHFYLYIFHIYIYINKIINNRKQGEGSGRSYV